MAMDEFVHQKIKNYLPKLTLISFKSKLQHHSYLSTLISYLKNLESINGIRFRLTYLYLEVQ
jgi:hypothetical protein